MESQNRIQAKTKIESRLLENKGSNSSTVKKIAADIEQKIFNAFPNEYEMKIDNLLNLLPKYYHLHPEDSIYNKVMHGKIDINELIKLDHSKFQKFSPRIEILKLFGGNLKKYAPHISDAKINEIVIEMEKSCFNMAVAICKNSDDPPCRNWSSQVFVGIYSSKCATVNNYIDPSSEACKLYGTEVIDKLLIDIDFAKEIGKKTEKELCPQAMARERAEILARTSQKIEEKESIMFRCPHCGERRCTYQTVQRRALDEAPDYSCKCLNPACMRRFTGKN